MKKDEKCMNVVVRKKPKNPKSSNWRIVIPNLVEYVESSPEQLLQLKQLVLERLHRRPQDKRSSIKSEFQRGLKYYTIAVERHANGVPHLDILLSYDRSIQRQLVDYDYLFKHGNITTYRKLNAAIIDYGKKEDKAPLSNFPEDSKQVLEFQDFKSDTYRYLELQMLQNPLHFNLQQYVRRNDLFKDISNWSSIKAKLKDSQVAAANLSLKQKPGFQLITQELIHQKLNAVQKAAYYGVWDGYRRVVHYLNQMILQKGCRQMKTLNLLITGAPSIGKTSLFHNPNHRSDRSCVQDFCSIFPMGMSQWFPKYQSYVYHMILWNQAKLTSYSYDTVLKLLEGSHMDLPNKGSVSRKVDNPLVVMTSNMTLQQMIVQKFPHSKSFQDMARKNLAVRIQNVIVPDDLDLFLLQKLLT